MGAKNEYFHQILIEMGDQEGKRAVQEEELEVICAIFDDVQDVRAKDVWKVSICEHIYLLFSPTNHSSSGV